MFTLEAEERHLALKPMNCPGHVQIFNQHLHSYRDLPLRMAEFGSCHRNEPSGALHGIMRVRAFTQDDAHIFCTPEQITAESVAFCDLLMQRLRDFGFTDVRGEVLRPAAGARRRRRGLGPGRGRACGRRCSAAGLECTLNPGEGAFYGPKLEFVLRDAIGRDWQCGTLQVDFVLPERLDANYVGEDGAKHRPVMLHRAILGSLERFIGMLIEHYAGRLPLWLAPVQAVVATITNEADGYAREVAERLRAAGVRAEVDTRGDKIDYKVREHSLRKVPLLLAVGGREQTERTREPAPARRRRRRRPCRLTMRSLYVSESRPRPICDTAGCRRPSQAVWNETSGSFCGGGAALEVQQLEDPRRIWRLLRSKKKNIASTFGSRPARSA